MPLVNSRHDGRSVVAPIAIIDVSRRKRQKSSCEGLLSGVTEYRALFDTGATTTMVTSRVVAELGLLPVGMAPFRGIHGIVSRPIYLFHVAFYGDEVQQAELAKRTIDTQKPVRKIYICPTAIEGGELEDQPNFDVLLGMDIIRTETLTISKEGSFSFGF